MSERVGFVGSRGFENMELVRTRVGKLGRWDVVVSGAERPIDTFPGKRDVDSVAIAEARRLGLRTAVFRVTREQWQRSKLAGKDRNWLLVGDCDRVEAFWDGTSNGTAHAVTAALRLGIPVRVWMVADSG